MSTPWYAIPNGSKITDPKEYRPSRSSVNGKPICAHMGTDPFGHVPV